MTFISPFEDHQHNFAKKDSDLVETFNLLYDYDSLMHYPNNAFAKPGTNSTIVAKVIISIWFAPFLNLMKKQIRSFFLQNDPNRKLGQIDGPSKYDIEKIRRMYDCQ